MLLTSDAKLTPTVAAFSQSPTRSKKKNNVISML